LLAPVVSGSVLVDQRQDVALAPTADAAGGTRPLDVGEISRATVDRLSDGAARDRFAQADPHRSGATGSKSPGPQFGR
jgi:hypothetical protein